MDPNIKHNFVYFWLLMITCYIEQRSLDAAATLNNIRKAKFRIRVNI